MLRKVVKKHMLFADMCANGRIKKNVCVLCKMYALWKNSWPPSLAIIRSRSKYPTSTMRLITGFRSFPTYRTNGQEIINQSINLPDRA